MKKSAGTGVATGPGVLRPKQLKNLPRLNRDEKIIENM
jgi:hypothetical protein